MATEARTRDAIVVGAGISGLTAAYYLARGGLDVSLLDACAWVGGVFDTRRDGDWLLEMGPNTVAEKPALRELIGHCGMAHERLPAGPASGRRYVWHRGRLRPLPASPPRLLTSRLLSWRGKRALLREPWVPQRDANAGEESVAELARRRLGDEALDVFVAPFVTGIHAGDPERLSARWTLPRLVALEEKHGSFLRGARAAKKQGQVAFRHPIVSFREGLATFAERLASFVPDVRRELRAEAIRRDGELLRVDTTEGPLFAPRVVLATAAADTATLLAPLTAGRSAELAQVPYAPLAVVCLGYRREQVRHRLDGFGFLTAPSTRLRLLGCLFTSTLFAGRAPERHVLLTCFVGGRRAPETLDQDDDALLRDVRADLATTLGARGQPALQALRRWPRAIPQYEIGHGRFVALAREIETATPGLRIVGSWLDGTGVGDCVALGERVANELLAAG